MQEKMLKYFLLCSFMLLTACSNTRTVDTSCSSMPVGTIHKNDTPKTKRWMYGYETNRQEICL